MEYLERTFNGKKTFLLKETSILVQGTNFLSSEFEIEIPFSELNPATEKLKIRSKPFFSGLWLALISFFINTVLIEVLGKKTLENPVPMFYLITVSGQYRFQSFFIIIYQTITYSFLGLVING